VRPINYLRGFSDLNCSEPGLRRAQTQKETEFFHHLVKDQANASVTLDKYGHLIPHLQEEAARLMDRLVVPIEVDMNK
jgi:hypothetical protein